MDLFVVNRHDETATEITAEREEKNIKNVLAKVAQRKQQKNEKKLLKSAIKRRKLRKLRIVKLPNRDEFIDSSIPQGAQNEVDEDEVEETAQKETKKGKNKLLIDPSTVKGFTILGDKNFDKKTKVKRVLPKWLANPIVISVNLQNLHTTVSSVKQLSERIRDKLAANGIQHLFPVQAEVIPWLLKSMANCTSIIPRDVCVSAPTGSGKTLAFVLPIVQALEKYIVKQIRALVILPTQDLADQVFKTFRMYADGTHLDVCVVTGRKSFVIEQKMLVAENDAFGYLSKTDILVCTAGRLVDHLKETKGLNLQSLQFLVFDEADRVLDNVQNDWLYHLEKHVRLTATRTLNLHSLKGPRPPQKLLFSATLSQDPEKLQKLSLFQPKLFTSVVEDAPIAQSGTSANRSNTFIGKYTTPKELTEKYMVCATDTKPLALYCFIKKEKLTKTIVFTHSVESTHRLCVLLQALSKKKLRVAEISSQLDTNASKKILDEFLQGNIDILVCTDKLARGMDLPGAQCVISYSAPKYIKTYIHRAGRTARAGEHGLAVTLLAKEEVDRFLHLLQEAGKTGLDEVVVANEKLESLVPRYQNALKTLKTFVRNEEDENLKKIKFKKGLSSRKRKRTDSLTAKQ